MAAELLKGPDGSGAVLSECGTYRYSLWRRWNTERPWCVWVMLNPSTADESEDDQTIRKCMGFAKRWGCGGIHVINLFAFRATDPKELRGPGDKVGPDNETFHKLAYRLIDPSGRRGGFCVAAWGAQPSKVLGDRPAQFWGRAGLLRVPVYTLGSTQDGHPKHPCMLAYDTPLEPVGIGAYGRTFGLIGTHTVV